MKESTAELSTTVIAIVAIAAILAVFTVFLLPTLRAQIALTQACSEGPDYHIENPNSKIECKEPTVEGNKKTWTCEYTYLNDDGSDGQKASKKCTQ